jgi:hypothetical protein
VVSGASEQVKLETVIAERAYDPKAVYGKGA